MADPGNGGPVPVDSLTTNWSLVGQAVITERLVRGWRRAWCMEDEPTASSYVG